MGWADGADIASQIGLDGGDVVRTLAQGGAGCATPVATRISHRCAQSRWSILDYYARAGLGCAMAMVAAHNNAHAATMGVVNFIIVDESIRSGRIAE